jgi:AcrR family transcriptional regulator
VRVNEKTKNDTRRRILDAAGRLFRENGFDSATTRDLAREADIAAGTLFNYFRSKEDLAMTLIADAAEEARAEFHSSLRPAAALDEALFAHVAVGLRHLRPHRAYIGDTLDAALSPFAMNGLSEAAERFRVGHIETVRALLLTRSEPPIEPSPMVVHLYWSLYLGVLSFWTADVSSNQEDTLVLLDQSLKLFVASLSRVAHRETEPHHADESR